MKSKDRKKTNKDRITSCMKVTLINYYFYKNPRKNYLLKETTSGPRIDIRKLFVCLVFTNVY